MLYALALRFLIRGMMAVLRFLILIDSQPRLKPLTPPTPTYATTMLAPTDMQESSLSHNEFAPCLRSLLQPSSALSPCEFHSMRLPACLSWQIPHACGHVFCACAGHTCSIFCTYLRLPCLRQSACCVLPWVDMPWVDMPNCA